MARFLVKITTGLFGSLKETKPYFRHINTERIYEVRQLVDERFDLEPLCILMKEHGFEEEHEGFCLTYENMKEMLKIIWKHDDDKCLREFLDAFPEQMEELRRQLTVMDEKPFLDDDEEWMKRVREMFRECEDFIIQTLAMMGADRELMNNENKYILSPYDDLENSKKK